MKFFHKFIFIFVILSLGQVNARVIQTTAYACCSPFGLCDLRLFSEKTVCQQICGGHNRCVPKEAYIHEHPLYGLPIGHFAPSVSSYVAGYTSEGTMMALAGAESFRSTLAPRTEFSVNVPIVEETKKY